MSSDSGSTNYLRKTGMKVLAALLLSLALTGCNTKDGVMQWANSEEINLTDMQAQQISEYWSLPQAQLISYHESCDIPCMIRLRWKGTGQEEKAIRVARCESNFNPRAKNRSSSASGVFQLIGSHWRGRFDHFDPVANIDYAYKLWKGSGWRPWVCKG